MPFRKQLGSALKWLYPGMGVKRWLVLLVLGLALISIGVSFFYVQVYRALDFSGAASPIAYWVTLQFLPHWMRGALLFGSGLTCIALAVLRLNNSLLSAVFEADKGRLVDVVYRRRMRKRGPRIVTIGGGTGLSALLRGLKEHSENITAIVTVADDGGSSGRLRRELGLLPPGDFRNCIAALADAEPLMTQLFQYRFGEGMSLDGHSFGNLFIAAMVGITGDFGQAIRESSRVLAVHGRILPSTMQSVTLCAELHQQASEHKSHIEGESRISKSGTPIERVYLQPDDARGYGEAVQALLEADLIVVGPGSLYTSILPNLLVKDITGALRASDALKVYVCNLATEVGETDRYDSAQHVQAIHDHVGGHLFDVVLINGQLAVTQPDNWKAEMVKPVTDVPYRTWATDLVDTEQPWRHDSAKLAQAVMDVYSRFRKP